jgi:O-antigen ligase
VKSQTLLYSPLVTAALGLYAITGIAGRTDFEADIDGVDESTMGRVDAWRTALKMALSRLLTGVGLDNYGTNFYALTEFWRHKEIAVHSTWFNVLAETGSPGLVTPFVIMAIICFTSSLRSLALLTRGNAPLSMRAMALAVVAGLVGFSVSGTFLTPFTVAIGRFARKHAGAHQSNE